MTPALFMLPLYANCLLLNLCGASWTRATYLLTSGAWLAPKSSFRGLKVHWSPLFYARRTASAPAAPPILFWLKALASASKKTEPVQVWHLRDFTGMDCMSAVSAVKRQSLLRF
ncbi:hypothetical protein DFH08DRAFT_864270 [Mycena albidolilacea]|uniref:Secreted protein n=1 Tax=Mycena albidolilacea TaxID=1033008 RepID=A0AAD7ESA3_9AGAR|nr:hypothetical protein DFH08DRAFT_864270 [Mycena albidolilacea]